MRDVCVCVCHMAEEEKRDNPYAEWVDTYKTEDFEGLADTLETLLDRYAERFSFFSFFFPTFLCAYKYKTEDFEGLADTLETLLDRCVLAVKRRLLRRSFQSTPRPWS